MPERTGFAMGWLEWLLYPAPENMGQSKSLSQNQAAPVVEVVPEVRDEPNFSLRSYTHTERHGALKIALPYVEITARENVVEIYDISINRGNCTVKQSGRGAAVNYPHQLTFGNVLRVYSDSACRIIEVTVTSDNGEWTATFQ